jgi:hypothetical protein
MRNKIKTISVFSLLTVLVLSPFVAFGIVQGQGDGGQQVEQGKYAPMLEKRFENDPEAYNKYMQLKVASVRKLMTVQVNRMEKFAERYGQIFGKVKARRDKLAAQNYEMTELNGEVLAIQEQITEVEKSIVDVKGGIAALDISNNPKLAAKEFMVSIRDLKKQMIQLHKMFKGAVKTMREMEQERNREQNTNQEQTEDQSDSSGQAEEEN